MASFFTFHSLFFVLYSLFLYGVATLAALRHLPYASWATSALVRSSIPAVMLFHTSVMV
jgi:hypothetical protein